LTKNNKPRLLLGAGWKFKYFFGEY